MTVQIKWGKNDKGQFVPVGQPGPEKTLSAQLVLLAMGFFAPEQPLLKKLGRETATPVNRSRRMPTYPKGYYDNFPALRRRRVLPPRRPSGDSAGLMAGCFPLPPARVVTDREQRAHPHQLAHVFHRHQPDKTPVPVRDRQHRAPVSLHFAEGVLQRRIRSDGRQNRCA
ncbi:hypothetical protein OPIT5_11425 [Opitutaceae bacterium TAV5]|nr:hypothetical protein OPIT5_11425 [Opitutaceae bacterium TAV5]